MDLPCNNFVGPTHLSNTIAGPFANGLGGGVQGMLNIDKKKQLCVQLPERAPLATA